MNWSKEPINRTLLKSLCAEKREIDKVLAAFVDMDLGKLVKDAASSIQRRITEAKNGRIEKKYLEAGKEFGFAVSYLYMGQCVDFEDRLDQLEQREEQYAALGYRTISVDAFERLGGYGRSVDELLRQIRADGEAPVFHAKLYREHFLNRSTIVTVQEDPNGVFIGAYYPPSTEALIDRQQS